MTSELDRDTAVLFDIGNVILFFDYGRFARAVEPDCDHSVQQLLALVEDPKLEMEANQLDSDGFLRLAIERIGYRGAREEFVRAWQEIFTLNEPIAAWIEELSEAGQRISLLSNTSELHVQYFTKEFTVFGRFHDWVYSHEANLLKPDPRIFQHAIDKLGLDPQKTVYLDDIAENAAAATAAGFRAICYTGQSQDEIIRQARLLQKLS